MFRRQQTQQTKPNSGIKSFSSRVERRRKAIVEEKKEEPVNPVKAIPKRTAKAEDLPVLKAAATTLTGDDVESIVSSGGITVTFKPLVGDYQMAIEGSNLYKISLSDELYGKVGYENTDVKLVFPSYQPATIKGVEILPGYGELNSDRIYFKFVKASDTNQSKTNYIPNQYDTDGKTTKTSVEITELYLVNPDDSKTAGDVFTVTKNKFSKISGYAATTYTSNNENHSDVKNLHSTNYIIKKTGETGEVENNLLVTGEIPPEVYDSLKLPFKLDAGLNVLAADSDVTYQINSVNEKPTPTAQLDTTSSINLKDVVLGNGDDDADTGENAIDLTGKFENFYVNNVTIRADDKDDVITRFTQVSGTKYLGSNVTILAAPAAGEGGVTAPVNDPLVPLIESITYTNNTITFNIKPNEKAGLLVENRKSTNETNHIIIDLSSSTFSTKLAQWAPSTETATNIAFVQEAVILNGEWTNTNGPVIGLNGHLGNQPETINTITINYFKKGVSGANDSIETVNLVTGTPSSTPADKQFKLGTVSNTVNMLYLVNGKVGSENRLLTPLSNAFSSTTSGETTTYSITGVPELVKVDNTTTLAKGQIGLYDRTKIGDNTKNAIIGDFYVTNLIPKFDPSADEQERTINLAVNGELPDWTIGSLWKDEVQEKGKYGYKVTQDATTKNKWTIGSDGKYINKVNWLPVDGYGELDIGVDFSTKAVLGKSDSPIVLPEDSTGTKNELKLLNFNMNEIYVKQTKSTADLDLTATVNHNYEGATVYNAVEMGGVSGTASPITDLISGFELNDTGKILTIKIKPSDKKNILKDYRKDPSDDAEEADKKAIILDITGNLNLCNSLVDALTDDATQKIIEPTGFVIEQEALILDDTDTTTSATPGKTLDVTMNESVAINSLTLKYLKLNNGKYEEAVIPPVTEPPSLGIAPGHKIDKLYFTHGTIVTQSGTNLRLITPLKATDVFITDDPENPTTYKVEIEDELIPSGTPSGNQIVLVQEADAVDELICTNIKNKVIAAGKTNIVVGGDKDTGIIPTWVFEQFKTSNKIGVSSSGVITGESAWTVTSINDRGCTVRTPVAAVAGGTAGTAAVAADDGPVPGPRHTTARIPGTGLPGSGCRCRRRRRNRMYMWAGHLPGGCCRMPD